MGGTSSPGRSLTLAADVVRAIVADVEGQGWSRDDLRRRFDLPLAALEDAEARVAAPALVRLWEGVPALLDDPFYGLHLAERSATRSIPLMARLFQASSTLGEGIERLVSIQRLLNDVHVGAVVRTPDGAAFRVRTRHSPLPVPRHAIDFAFAWMTLAARRATAMDLAPQRVSFEHSAPASAGEYRRVLGCTPVFDADANEIAIATETLSLPIATPDPELAALLERHARILLERLPEGSTFTLRVRDALVPLLESGPTVEKLARALKVSERSVQRYLMREGTSFAAVLDEVRCRRAEVLLRDSSRSIAEISSALGFADQSTIHRAFVRWKSTTPGAYRRASR
jgi:AraC-like DNA-binding protein